MEPGYENFAVDVPKWQRDKVYAFAEAKNVTPWLPRVRFDAFWQKNEKEMTNDVNTDPAITKMPLVVTTMRTTGTSSSAPRCRWTGPSATTIT